MARRAPRRLWARRLVATWMVGVVLAPWPAQAWGVLGHQVVAEVAEQQLTPAARAGVAALLAAEPGATLASIASWADAPGNRSTGRWHYVNLPRGDCRYVAARDCPDGQCVVRAIADQLRRLRAASASAAERLEALKYLVHLVADIHQPLHAGHADDRGGNLVPLALRMAATNLHALWDWGLLALESDDAAVWGMRVAALANTPPPDGAGDAHNASEAEWDGALWAQLAEEGCRLVAEAGFVPATVQVDDAYVQRYTPVAARQLALAARRLAGLLNAQRW